MAYKNKKNCRCTNDKRVDKIEIKIKNIKKLNERGMLLFTLNFLL